MKTAGRAFGFERYADAITQTSSGRYVVDDAGLREEMMKLRTDPTANAVMGGVMTQQNAAVLGRRIGRQPTEGELYMAHFFGPHAAARVIELAASEPNAEGAALFPEAARANRSVFYDRQGNARTIAGVRDELVRRYQAAKAHTTPDLAPNTPAKTLATTPATPAAPVRQVADTAGVTMAFAAAQSVPVAQSTAPAGDAARLPPRSAFHSLFETENRQGAISPIVAELWTPRGAPASADGGLPLERLYQEPRRGSGGGS